MFKPDPYFYFAQGENVHLVACYHLRIDHLTPNCLHVRRYHPWSPLCKEEKQVYTYILTKELTHYAFLVQSSQKYLFMTHSKDQEVESL